MTHQNLYVSLQVFAILAPIIEINGRFIYKWNPDGAFNESKIISFFAMVELKYHWSSVWNITHKNLFCIYICFLKKQMNVLDINYKNNDKINCN